MDEPVANLDEIRSLSGHLPGPDLEAGSLAATRQAQLTKPAGALGRLEELAIWLRAPWFSPAITGSRRAAFRPTPPR